MNSRYLALLAAFAATTIYGINHTIAKEVMPIYIGSFGFIMLRLLGATALFWIISCFTPKEKVDKKDFIIIIIASILGMCINMLAFFRGLELSTPINSGVIIIAATVETAVRLTERAILLRAIKQTTLDAVPPGQQATNTIPMT